jgi:hypothetical protein
LGSTPGGIQSSPEQTLFAFAFRAVLNLTRDYTSGALDCYNKEDVAGLLEDRLGKAREHLEEALEAAIALCEPVEMPKDSLAYFRYFSAKDHGNVEQLKENEPKRLSLYKLTASLIRAYADLANEMEEAGYGPAEIETIKTEVKHFESIRDEVKKHSGDAIDLKMYEPAMRHLIDAYNALEKRTECQRNLLIFRSLHWHGFQSSGVGRDHCVRFNLLDPQAGAIVAVFTLIQSQSALSNLNLTPPIL